MAKSDLLTKIMKNSTIKATEMLDKQPLLHDKDMITTSVPMINVALSGRVDGGLIPGLTVLAGPSKHFKSLFALVIGSAFLKKYPEGILLFYDSEFGTPTKYFEALDMDMLRIVHTPITNIEELKHDLVAQLEGFNREDKVCIIVDSVGNLASNKEVQDAKDKKSVADMTRAKALKSLFRIVTPYLTVKDIPLIAINHTYKTQELYSKDVVSGGCLTLGTKIRMFDNSLKNIEEITPGDIVSTMMGPKIVTNSWNPETLINGNPECYEVEFDDGYKVICSNNHQFLVENEWIKTENLRPGMKVTTKM